jgi:histidinol dehydrogenase
MHRFDAMSKAEVRIRADVLLLSSSEQIAASITSRVPHTLPILPPQPASTQKLALSTTPPSSPVSPRPSRMSLAEDF